MLRQVLAMAVGALVLMPTSAPARQITNTATGTIVGVAADASGAVIPGVLVTLSGDALMRPWSTLTADDGRYRFAALSPGRYRLSFSRSGFASHVQDVRIGIGFTTTIDVILEVAVQREEVIVGGPGSVLDRQSAALTETFDSRLLGDLPVSRSLGGLLATAHAVQLSPVDFDARTGILAGAQSAYGKNSSPRHTIEGIIVTGLFGGGFALDYGSFEEALVLTGAHGAEWPTPGIHTQVVTKSGSNQYRGTFYADYADRHWQSRNIDADQARRLDPGGDGESAREANRHWSYRDVNADVGGFVLKERLWWYSSARDQDVATRLVNFPVKPSSTRLTNYSAKATYRAAPGHTIVAYGQRGLNHQPYRLDPFGPAGSELSADTAINFAEESTADQQNASWIWKGQWDAVVNESLIFEVRAGQFGNGQAWKARGNRPRFEDVETLVVSGANRDWQSDGRRNQAFGTLSYFRDGPAGSHLFKVGGEISRWLVSDAWRSGYPGGVLHVLRSGRPSAVFLFDTPTDSRSGVWTYSVYASDSWRPGDRLSVNFGLRFDRYRAFLPAQEHLTGGAIQPFAAVGNLIDWNMLGPRISAVYDVTGDGRTLAKVAVARYHVAPNANLGFSANPNPPQWWSQYTWSDANGSGVWEPGEEGPRRSQRGGTAIESLDPALHLPVLNEVAAWLERELPAGMGVRTGLIWRGGHRHFARRNARQPFDIFTLPVSLRDPGPDGAAGSSDDGPVLTAYDLSPLVDTFQTANVVGNVADADTEYWTWEIAARRRFMSRWSFGAGFAQTWNRDHAQGYLGQALRNNAYPLTPNDLINTDPAGRHEFTTWTAKAHATYEAPWGIRLTPVLLHQSGQPFGRTFTTDRSQIRYATVTVLAEPVGTRRMDNITLVDLRVEKSFRLSGERRIAGILDIVNCFNANPAQNVIWSSGPSFLRPVSILPPRNARVGVKFDW